MRTALLLGATGLVGGAVLDLLLNDAAYSKVVTLGRRPLAHEHQKLEQHVIDFERLSDFASVMIAQDLFCCLGTTIKKAESKDNFHRVDFTYQYEAAQLASSSGAE